MDNQNRRIEVSTAGEPQINAMIDLETLGTKPGCAILSIGAAMFGPAGVGETFYSPVLLQSCADFGLAIDASTVAWWMEQSAEARAAAFRVDAPPLQNVLCAFIDWFVAQQAKHPWCHGATFDVPILEAAFQACGLAAPWEFWNVRDTRTLYDLAGVKPDRSNGTHHHALDDAISQANAAVKAMAVLDAHLARQSPAPIPEQVAQTSGIESLTRYDEDHVNPCVGSMAARGNGEWVKFADVERLLATQSAKEVTQQAAKADEPDALLGRLNSYWLTADGVADIFVKLSEVRNLLAPTTSTVSASGALGNAFITLESNGGEGRAIVLKFNNRSDAYAVHDFLLKGGGREWTPTAAQAATDKSED